MNAPRPTFLKRMDFDQAGLHFFGTKFIVFGYQVRPRWRFRIEAPIRSARGIYFGGILIDYFHLSFWLYSPLLRIDPPPPKPRSIYRIPKGAHR